MRAHVFLLAGTLALAACDREPPEPVAPDPEAVLTVTPEGIDGPDFAALEFGVRRGTVIQRVGELFDAEPQETSNSECGVGPMDFADFDGLVLNFQDDEFVGWFLRGREGVAAPGGIAIDAPLSAVTEEESVKLEGSTLDGEFTYTLPQGSDLGGFTDPQGRVEALYAGTNCFFR